MLFRCLWNSTCWSGRTRSRPLVGFTNGAAAAFQIPRICQFSSVRMTQEEWISFTVTGSESLWVYYSFVLKQYMQIVLNSFFCVIFWALTPWFLILIWNPFYSNPGISFVLPLVSPFPNALRLIAPQRDYLVNRSAPAAAVFYKTSK